MVEGRCPLSSFVMGEAPNTYGVCSPAAAVCWEPAAGGLEAHLNGVLIDRYADGESASYPTLCKGRFAVGGENYYAIEEAASLNTLALLPQLLRASVRAIKIEGRQRSLAYVAQVTRVWRAAIDHVLLSRERFAVKPVWMTQLNSVAEGQQYALGADRRALK